MPSGADWFSDVKVSLPNPPPDTPQVDLGGFWFSNSGICHNITQAASEDLSAPFQGTPQA
jgi:hypothetical protein